MQTKTNFCLFAHRKLDNEVYSTLAALKNFSVEIKVYSKWFLFCVQLADQFCNAIGVLQQCAPPASFGNIQTAINKDQPANPTEGKFWTVNTCRCYVLHYLLIQCISLLNIWCYCCTNPEYQFNTILNWWYIVRSVITHNIFFQVIDTVPFSQIIS